MELFKGANKTKSFLEEGRILKAGKKTARKEGEYIKFKGDNGITHNLTMEEFLQKTKEENIVWVSSSHI
jgi:hypothetical protein